MCSTSDWSHHLVIPPRYCFFRKLIPTHPSICVEGHHETSDLHFSIPAGRLTVQNSEEAVGEDGSTSHHHDLRK